MSPVNWPYVLIEYGKHAESIYLIRDQEQMDRTVLAVLAQRLEDDYIYSDDEGGDYTRAKRILANKDGEDAWMLLRERSDDGYEYERIELENPYEV